MKSLTNYWSDYWSDRYRLFSLLWNATTRKKKSGGGGAFYNRADDLLEILQFITRTFLRIMLCPASILLALIDVERNQTKTKVKCSRLPSPLSLSRHHLSVFSPDDPFFWSACTFNPILPFLYTHSHHPRSVYIFIQLSDSHTCSGHVNQVFIRNGLMEMYYVWPCVYVNHWPQMLPLQYLPHLICLWGEFRVNSHKQASWLENTLN